MEQQVVFENIRSMIDKVDYILRKYPDTRNYDDALTLKVANDFQLNPVHIKDSVTRIRRRFNQQNKYLPTIKEVAIQRRLNIESWQKALGYGNQLF